MIEVLDYILKSTIILMVFFTIYNVAFSSDKNFFFNRFYLLGSSIIALTIPFLNIPVAFYSPASEISIQNAIEIPGVTISGSLVENPVNSFNWATVLFWIYMSGVLALSIRFFIRIVRIALFIRNKRSSTEQKYDYFVIPTEGRYPTSSFLNYLLLDDTSKLSESELDQVISHEEAHIRQRHTIDILYLELLSIVFWFNPLIYLYKNALTQVHEYLADEEASAKINLNQYLGLLAWQTLKSKQLTLSTPFIKSQTIKRMNMLKSSKKRRLVWNVFLTVPILAMLLYVFACESSNQAQELDSKPSIDARATDLQLGEIFTEVDKIPEPVDGMKAFYRYVMQNMTYPAEARKAGIEGKVFVEFVVDKTGKVQNVVALKGISHGCDEVAVSVIENSPAWNPGVNGGEKVNVKMVIPITFKLDKKDGQLSSETNKSDRSVQEFNEQSEAESLPNKAKEVVVVGYPK
jgi:TonB family protein